MNRCHGFVACLALVLAARSAPALADSAHRYRVEAEATRWIDLNICSSDVSVEITGDHDTDLDFWVFSPRGSLVHEDTDDTDYTSVDLGSDGRCRTYKLEVKNFGDVYNLMTVRVTDN